MIIIITRNDLKEEAKKNAFNEIVAGDVSPNLRESMHKARVIVLADTNRHRAIKGANFGILSTDIDSVPKLVALEDEICEFF